MEKFKLVKDGRTIMIGTYPSGLTELDSMFTIIDSLDGVSIEVCEEDSVMGEACNKMTEEGEED